MQRLFDFAEREKPGFNTFGADDADSKSSGSRFAASLDWDRASSRKGDQFGWRIYNGESVVEAGKCELLGDRFWDGFSGGTVVVERAHLIPRTRKSKAQIYEQRELDMLATVTSRNLVTVLLLPESQGYRIRETTGHDKDEMAIANWKFYASRTDIPLQRWPIVVRCQKQKDALPAIKEDMNILLNEMRTMNYESHPLYEKVASILDSSLSVIPTDQETREALTQMKSDFDICRKKGRISFNNTSVMTVAAMVFDSDFRLRTNPGGEFIGVRTALRSVSLHAFKGSRSGVARSNIMYHFMPKGEKSEDAEVIRDTRRRKRRSIRTLLKLLRDGVAAK